jgi:photosystem II stability/assembly factor-like uncharacterized protein
MPNHLAARPSVHALACVLLAACARGPAPADAGAGAGAGAPRWVEQPSGTRASLRGVSAVSDRVAWASGSAGTVLRTVDGGATWRRDSVPGASALDFRDVHAVSDRVAYVVSAGEAEKGLARIYKTTDAGRSWTLQYADSTPGMFFDAIAFWDADHGVAVSDPVAGRFVVVRTDDGGRTWTRVPPAGIPPVAAGEAAFAAGGTCLTVAPGGHAWFGTGGTSGSRVYHSADGGRTWTVADAPVQAGNESSGIFAVAFRDALHGAAVGGDYRKAREGERVAAYSADGGRTWSAAPGAVRGYWSGAVYVPGSTTVVAVGLAGSAYSMDDGRTYTVIDTAGFNAVSFASAGAGWAVGANGRVARLAGALPTPRAR